MVGLGCLRKQSSKQLDSVVSASAPAWIPSLTSSNGLWSGPGSQIDLSLPICFLLCLSARGQKLVPVSGILLWRAWPCCVREYCARPLELWAGELIECLGLNGCSVRAWKIRMLRAGRRGKSGWWSFKRSKDTLGGVCVIQDWGI